MKMQRNSFSRRLGSIAGLLLAFALAAVLAGSAPSKAGGSVLSARDASADLSLTLTHDPEPAKAYDTVVYRMNVTNTGRDAATDVGISVNPVGGEFVSSSSCQPRASGPILCTVGTILPGQSVAINYSFRVPPGGGLTTAS